MGTTVMTYKQAKPFVKWAGGKSQLLDEITACLPPQLQHNPFTYIEPFAGGGSALFKIMQSYPTVKKAVINDINADLINAYKTIKEAVDPLIETLKAWQAEYHALLHNDRLKKEYYYNKRRLFNSRTADSITQAALFIFLNKTCFNGLYRVNRKNEFNVPVGSYKKPLICDEDNLREVNRLLQKVTIVNADFEQTIEYAEGNTLFYFDPPYKPISETSNFNSYAQERFDDNEQMRLARFCKRLDSLGYQWVLSNSHTNDGFFEQLYAGFIIKKVKARRNINANPHKRNAITELLITNIKPV